ncbi:hypothetical protein ENSA5_41780 [Enhygromyxa salina]|uniref:ATP-grasp domain-containing protein n=1 Tax=Enhygromyxa salina TaxID=215803 RepID=A0A2S9XMG4_9BACT|nr:STM4014 family protein [Enhygromyxa salina]PRP94066.1 hypothetical protein ENSA5_41780 [Enhygromyxa salina]
MSWDSGYIGPVTEERARYLIIGNPDNRRVTGFVDALDRRGLPPPILLSHRELMRDVSALAALPDEPLTVRIDACGEDPEIERTLLELGADALDADLRCERISRTELARTPYRFGQIRAPRQHHAGFVRYLDTLASVLRARPSWRVLTPIADIRALFDKRETSRRYAALGIPVPEPLPGLTQIEEPEQLREAMVAQRWPAVFVKLSSGSSASCLALYRHLPGRPPAQRDLLLTTVATAENGRFNSLRLQRLHEREPVDALLRWLIGEGVQIERAVPKARIDRWCFDLRVLVVAGAPAFCVVRQSRHPITNLHLGGQRGDLDGLRRRMSSAAWDAAMRSCERVFAAHGCLHVGVDVLLEPGLERHRVIEANAFGDLLPRLTREGKSVYEWEIEAAARTASVE